MEGTTIESSQGDLTVASSVTADIPATPPDPRSKVLMHSLAEATKDNTPNKRKSTSDVWNNINRLKSDFYDEKYTHVCIQCNRLLVVTKTNTDAWQSTKALYHLKNCPNHNQSGSASTVTTSIAVTKSEIKEEKVRCRIQTALFHTDTIDDRQIVSGGITRVDPISRAVASIAKFYVYSKQRISKRTLEDPYFRRTCENIYLSGSGGRKKEDAPFLSRSILQKHIEAEYNHLKFYIKFIVDESLKFSGGNPFGQGLNNCVKLCR